MILLYIISFILCILNIWILKHSRDIDTNKPVLKMWHMLLLIVFSLIPIFNIIFNIISLIVIFASYAALVFKWKSYNNNKLITFLNKYIY